MKSELRNIIEKLNPKIFGVDNIKIDSFKRLGVGECNVNYLLKIEKQKYLCRVSIDKEKSNKSEIEFNNLKKIQHSGISPKPLFFFKRNKDFERDFIILEFIQGKPLRMGQRTYSSNQIKKIAKTLSKLHSLKIKLPITDKSPYYEVFKYAKEFQSEINKYTNNKYQDWLKQLIKQVNKSIPNTKNYRYSLTHGDVYPQNVVETKSEMKLIDWESVSYSDPARDIVNILVDFGLKGKQLNLFYDEYFKNRKDNNLQERVKIHQILTRTNYFLWEVVRTFEILKKELPKEYLQKTTAKSHFNEAKKQFKELKALIDISQLDIAKLFTKYKID